VGGLAETWVMVELGTRHIIERVRVGNSPPNAACAVFLSRPLTSVPSLPQDRSVCRHWCNIDIKEGVFYVVEFNCHSIVSRRLTTGSAAV
ncbi:MAG: hypothetical protein KJP23_26635, partial [Deltaproteobacteria bacterium]|nr:hypothetical protein [Deltaproteobacteria bacterium]